MTSRSTCNTCLIIDETGLWECIQEVWINKCQLNNIKYFQKRNGHHVLPSLCSARHLLAINLEQVEIVLYEWHSGVKSEKWASQLGWVTFEDQFRVENVRVYGCTRGVEPSQMGFLSSDIFIKFLHSQQMVESNPDDLKAKRKQTGGCCPCYTQLVYNKQQTSTIFQVRCPQLGQHQQAAELARRVYMIFKLKCSNASRRRTITVSSRTR